MVETVAQIEEDQLKWSSAPNYAAVLDLNRQYLRGEMMTTPYNHRSVHHETKPDEKLLPLHDYGFLAFDWQPGKHVGPDCEIGQMTMDGELKCEGNGTFSEIQTRDCIHFMMPLGLFKHDALQVFWLSLIRHPAIVTRIVTKRHGRLYPGSTESPHVVVSGNLDSDPYPIARRRAAPTVDRLKDVVYLTYGYAPPVPFVTEASKWKCDALSKTLPLEFWVAAKRWAGTLRVAVLVEDLAVAAGLKTVYTEGSAGNVGSAASETLALDEDIICHAQRSVDLLFRVDR